MFDSLRTIDIWRERPWRGIRPRVTSASPPRLFDRALIARRLDRALKTPDAGRRFPHPPRRRGAWTGSAWSSVRFRSRPTSGPRRRTPRSSSLQRPGARLTLRLAPTLSSAKLGGDAIVGDLERLPFARHSLDLAASIYALHAVNDLPGASSSKFVWH